MAENKIIELKKEIEDLDEIIENYEVEIKDVKKIGKDPICYKIIFEENIKQDKYKKLIYLNKLLGEIKKDTNVKFDYTFCLSEKDIIKSYNFTDTNFPDTGDYPTGINNFIEFFIKKRIEYLTKEREILKEKFREDEILKSYIGKIYSFKDLGKKET